MTLEYIRFMVFTISMGVLIIYSSFLLLGNKYNIKLGSANKLITIWLGSLSLGSLIGIDFLLQGLKRVLELILLIDPLWVIGLTLVLLNIILFYQLQKLRKGSN